MLAGPKVLEPPGVSTPTHGTPSPSQPTPCLSRDDALTLVCGRTPSCDSLSWGVPVGGGWGALVLTPATVHQLPSPFPPSTDAPRSRCPCWALREQVLKVETEAWWCCPLLASLTVPWPTLGPPMPARHGCEVQGTHISGQILTQGHVGPLVSVSLESSPAQASLLAPRDRCLCSAGLWRSQKPPQYPGWGLGLALLQDRSITAEFIAKY